MPTNYDDVNAKCPYFVGCKKTNITCEGLTEDSVVILHFNTNEKRQQHRDIFCNNKYKNCEVCRMLDEKNEE